MGDEDDAALERFQVVLQPGDAFGVEMVGRLVEEQHVGFGQEKPGEGDAPRLAAGQLVDRPLRRRTAQCVHGLLDAAVDVP